MNQLIYKSAEGQQALMQLYETVLARWPAPHQKLAVPTRHGQTFVLVCGEESAPPLVLLHGSSTNSAMWAGDVAEYSRYYRVYALDTPGEPGKSAPNRLPLKGPAYAEWLEDVLEALNVKKATLIGCSQGGWIALRFSTLRPERVARLVLLTPGGVTPVRLPAVLRIIAVSLFGRRGAEAVKRMVYGNLVVPAEVETFSNLVQNHYNPRTDAQPLFADEELRRLVMPVLLVVGAEDCFYAAEKVAARLQKLLPHFHGVILPETGHVLLDVKPYVMPFLAA